eukprot:5106577-Amphidinium_carterae.1
MLASSVLYRNQLFCVQVLVLTSVGPLWPGASAGDSAKQPTKTSKQLREGVQPSQVGCTLHVAHMHSGV